MVNVFLCEDNANKWNIVHSSLLLLISSFEFVEQMFFGI